MSVRIKNLKLGEALLQEEIITKEQLDEALSLLKTDEFKDKNMLLGEILVYLGYCTDYNIAAVMAKKTNSILIDLNEFKINIDAANLITPDIATRYKAIPLDYTENKEKLMVAMKNPSDLIAIDDLSLLTGYEIVPVVVEDRQMEVAIENFSNMSNSEENTFTEEEAEEEEADEKEPTMARPAVQLANQLLNQAVNVGASDVHIEPHEKKLKIRLRIDGVLHDIMNQSPKMAPSISSRFKVLGNMNIAERRIPQDGRMTFKKDNKIADIRIATLPTVFGEKVTLRIADRSSSLITLDKLGMPDRQLKPFYSTIKSPYGFILITGPTGSGKSTTLYAALAILNVPDKNIITVEDPVERRIEGLNQIQINEKADLTFATALRSIIRSDPDIIMIGEIRDHETAKIAVEASLTGHLVLSTLHTNTSAGAITRLDDMGIEPYLTSSSLIGIMAQRLVRKLCNDCKEAYEISRADILNIFKDFPINDDEDYLKIFKPKGCINCSNTGYKGRTGVYEFLTVTESIKEMILRRNSTIDIEKKAIEEGMVTLRMDGLYKIKSGVTSIEEFYRVIV